METDSCKSKIQINGYFVYTRRKRNHHRDFDNEEPKRLKIDENVDAVKNDVVKWTSKRQRRPSFKVKVDSGEDVSAAGKLAAESVKIEKNETVGEKWLTMKELFDTGFLDGVPVVYVGCKKEAINSRLEGVIAGGGILCSCCLCNGRRIIPPSTFEIHACNIYKRATQYICFENGKSLLELLGVCRAAPSHSMEATIQNFLCLPPEEKYFTCRSCRGAFPVSTVKRVGLICHSCVEASKSEDSPIRGVGKRVRYLFIQPLGLVGTVERLSVRLESLRMSVRKVTGQENKPMYSMLLGFG